VPPRKHRRRSAKSRRILTRLTIKVEPHAYPGVYVITATSHGRKLGYMEIEEAKGRQKVMKVAFAETRKTGIGIGTKLYETAARTACKLGAPLASDSSRTRFSQAFWEKQVTKGRATCMAGSGRAVRLTDEFGRKGTWRCGTYALTCPAPRSLAQVKLLRKK